MRINELLTKSASKPVIYVDMDGVLADLFNHVAVIHDVDHYNDMSDEQWEKFFAGSNAYELFRKLPAFSTANQLLKLTQPYGGYTIMSSPLNYDPASSIKGKREWLAKHISVPANGQIFEKDKAKYAVQQDGTPNILIDDWGVNVRNWNAAGGIAIKYQADEDNLSVVKNGLYKAMLLIKQREEKLSEGTLTIDIAHALKRYGEHVHNLLIKRIGELFGKADIENALHMIRELDPEDRAHVLNIMSKSGGKLGQMMSGIFK